MIYSRITTLLTHGRMMCNRKDQTKLETLMMSRTGTGNSPECSAPILGTGSKKEYTCATW